MRGSLVGAISVVLLGRGWGLGAGVVMGGGFDDGFTSESGSRIFAHPTNPRPRYKKTFIIFYHSINTTFFIYYLVKYQKSIAHTCRYYWK